MSKYICAAVAAEVIAEKHGIPLGDLVDTFSDIPAADVAPVRRGRWIEEDGGCRCGSSPIIDGRQAEAYLRPRAKTSNT